MGVLLNESLQSFYCLRTIFIVTFTSPQVNAYTSSVGVGPGTVSTVETVSAEAPSC